MSLWKEGSVVNDWLVPLFSDTQTLWVPPSGNSHSGPRKSRASKKGHALQHHHLVPDNPTNGVSSSSRKEHKDDEREQSKHNRLA